MRPRDFKEFTILESRLLDYSIAMPVATVLTIDRIVHLYFCKTLPVAVPLVRLPSREWIESLPFFSGVNSSIQAISGVLSQAYTLASDSVESDISLDIHPEEILAGVRLLWMITFFQEGPVRLLPAFPVAHPTVEGEPVVWIPAGGGTMVEPPASFELIAERVIQARGLSSPKADRIRPSRGR